MADLFNPDDVYPNTCQSHGIEGLRPCGGDECDRSCPDRQLCGQFSRVSGRPLQTVSECPKPFPEGVHLRCPDGSTAGSPGFPFWRWRKEGWIGIVFAVSALPAPPGILPVPRFRFGFDLRVL